MDNLEKYYIQEEACLTDVLRKLDKIGGEPLFVLRENRLVAAVTDGDVRRYILNTGNIQAHIRDVANYSPKYVYPGEEELARDWMRRERVRAVPVVDAELHILYIMFQKARSVESPATISLPVVINAGGKGTRLYPYTKILPKPLIPIGDIPIAELIIERFCRMGCTQFYMIVNHKKNMIKAYFNENEAKKKDYTLHFIDEEIQLGTGGGLSLLKEALRETFIFANCDTIIEEDFEKIVKSHKLSGNLITMITALKHFDIPYGVVETGENGCIMGFTEKPQMSFLTNTGCYIVEPQVVQDMKNEEAIGFPTVIERYRSAGKPVGIYPVSEQAWLDMGQFESMEAMKARLNIDE